MCITFFRIAPDKEVPFVVAFNRDEVTMRESEQARFLEAEGMPNIVCGIDKPTKSTWLAYNK